MLICIQKTKYVPQNRLLFIIELLPSRWISLNHRPSFRFLGEENSSVAWLQAVKVDNQSLASSTTLTTHGRDILNMIGDILQYFDHLKWVLPRLMEFS